MKTRKNFTIAFLVVLVSAFILGQIAVAEVAEQSEMFLGIQDGSFDELESPYGGSLDEGLMEEIDDEYAVIYRDILDDTVDDLQAP